MYFHYMTKMVPPLYKNAYIGVMKLTILLDSSLFVIINMLSLSGLRVAVEINIFKEITQFQHVT